MDTSQQKLKSIDCKHCGAPISLRGGHRVKSIVCTYCGSVLHAEDGYEQIRGFIKAPRPHSHIKLGMSGTIKGVQHIVIGIVQYRTAAGYAWIAAQLFSPTHGYAWLEYEGGHFVFSRTVRDIPEREPVKSTKATIKARGRIFKVYDFYSAKVAFVEGELTFIAKQGDRVEIIEAMAPPYLYVKEKSASEIEYSLGEYLPPEEIYASFKIEGKPVKRTTIHAAQPFNLPPIVDGMSASAKYFAPLTLVIALLIWLFGNGNTILDERISPQQFVVGTQTQPFTVSEADDLLRLSLYSDLNNAWAWFDVSVLRNDQELYSLGKEIAYYSGYEGGEHWSEGTQSAHAYFKLPQSGNYTLLVAGEGGQGSSGTRPQNKALHISIEEGVTVSRYFFILALFFLIALSLKYFIKARFESRRWKAVTGDD